MANGCDGLGVQCPVELASQQCGAHLLPALVVGGVGRHELGNIFVAIRVEEERGV